MTLDNFIEKGIS